MSDHLKPDNADQLLEAMQWAVSEQCALEVLSSGTKREIGNPARVETRLDMSAFSGITLYEPEELVLSARAATPRAEVEAALTAKNQEFAFEPPDFSRLLGANHEGTLVGMVASNFAGPRRIKAGAVRDHFLGFSAVSGRGEAFKSGGRVVKNVTGYDLCKVMAGSWGTLGVMSDITLKVLPAAETQSTLMLTGLSNGTAMKAMSAAMQSSCEVSGAAHIPEDLVARSKVSALAGAGQAVTLLRLEGIAASVNYRFEKLASLLAPFAEAVMLEDQHSTLAWSELRDVHYLAEDDACVWRISVAPMAGAGVAYAILQKAEAQLYFDWAGGLIWCAVKGSDKAHADAVRQAVDAAGGHATLIKAPEAVRAAAGVFHPLKPGID
ncbi:MAG: FAD-binding protein, partial [Hyphomicrobiales bacterium]